MPACLPVVIPDDVIYHETKGWIKDPTYNKLSTITLLIIGIILYFILK